MLNKGILERLVMNRTGKPNVKEALSENFYFLDGKGIFFSIDKLF
jgi:hypothetical protein